jgi:hypothetical protein
MPAKRRTAKSRNPQITDEAVELFRRCLELREVGAHEIDYDGDDDGHSPERLEYMEKSKRLEWGIFGLVGDASPLDVFPGVERYGNELYQTTFPHALELRRQLIAAMRQGKKLDK